MDASEDIITAMGSSSDGPWSDDMLAWIVDLPLLVEPTDAQFSRHHPVFELEVSDILRRRRDTAGAYTGDYEVVRFEYAIRRRDPASIGALIASHRALVEAHEDLFAEDGTPLVPEEEITACYGREQEGLRSLLAAPCRTLHDASLKAAYLRENFDLGDLALQGEFEAFLGSLIVERRA